MRKRWDEVIDRLPIHGTLVEVGVWRGDLSSRLLAARPDARIVLVDPWRSGDQQTPWAESGSLLAQTTQREMEAIYAAVLGRMRPYADRVHVLRLLSVEASGQVESCEAVFLDANHSAEAVAADIRAWRPKVRAGGWMGGHDYGHPRFPGVAASVDAVFPDRILGADRTWFARIAQ
jgi:hypothetical protein